jgi:hypothetical protein
VLGLAPQGLWFPPLVELLIAASIVAMALENLVGTTARRRWIAAFAFGLVHGFGFAFALRETLHSPGRTWPLRWSRSTSAWSSARSRCCSCWSRC